MANGHGGARIGAGQKKKPLAVKLQDGNPGRRPLDVVVFPTADLTGEDMPPPQDYLAAKQKDGGGTIAVEVYGKTWRWLKERSCAHLIPPQVLENYAQTVGRWVQCEEAISAYGFLSNVNEYERSSCAVHTIAKQLHTTTGAPIPSPFVSMSQSFMKQANSLWFQIYQIMRENCAAPFEGKSPQDDVMERLLSARSK
jgi:hypothetical protein